MAQTPVELEDKDMGGTVIVPETELKATLAGLGVGVPKGIVLGPNDIHRCDLGLNFPVVAKYVSPTLIHKGEKGGVITDLCSKRAATKGARDLFKRFGPDGRVLIEEQLRAGEDCFIGLERHEVFGPIIYFGPAAWAFEGGNGLFMPLPIDLQRAERALRGQKLPKGTDTGVLVRMLADVGELFLEHDEWHAIDLNPVRFIDGEAWVLDAKAYVEKEKVSDAT